ncbi:uncharacterized protein LOC131658594 [Vicia villosa]|uniref:uncharacterized protein LOC131658594 n=1 Tax=Vicia villosa TaxID=3911 RepID=UPI00273BF512|nr:uncharacterized protein LOC131658594 [Vicia villosa]
MHFMLTTLKVVHVLSTPIPELEEDDTVENLRRQSKWENNDYICRWHILNGMSDPLFDIYQNVEYAKELWDCLEAKYMAEDSSSKKFLVTDFNNYKMVESRSVMEQFNELLRILGQFTLHGLKMDETISVSSIIDKLPPSWKDFKHNLKHGKDELSLIQLGSHLRIEESLRAHEDNKGKGKEIDDVIAWWIDSGATTHVCKDRFWFKTFVPVEDGFFLYMGDDHFAPVEGKGNVVLEFSSGKTITLFNVLYVPKLRKNLISGPVLNKLGYKQITRQPFKSITRKSIILELIHSDLCDLHATPSLGNKKYFVTFIDDASRFCYVYLLHAKDEALDKFKIYKTEVEVQRNMLIKTLRTDRGGEYYDPVFFQSVGIIHETTAPYTP